MERLDAENVRLRDEVRRLGAENAQLREEASADSSEGAGSALLSLRQVLLALGVPTPYRDASDGVLRPALRPGPARRQQRRRGR